MRRFRLGALAGVLLLAACGSGSTAENHQRTVAGSGTLQALAQGPGQTVAITPGDADFAPGPLRYTFLVIAHDGRVVSRPRATVWVARGLQDKPFLKTTATLEPIGVPGVSKAAKFGVESLYVAHVRIPAAGTYWVLARPAGARIAGLGNIVVNPESASPAVGAPAPKSNTPTLASTGGNFSTLTTAKNPDPALYRSSVAQAVAAHAPFVLTFATPKFCSSRTCGPVVDVVSHVRRQFTKTPVRFIHVEVYEHNDPAQGYNRWMRQWHLESEPWVFLVGADGRIKDKFEGSVSAGELQNAVRRELIR
jgi:hypothetical protein